MRFLSDAIRNPRGDLRGRMVRITSRGLKKLGWRCGFSEVRVLIENVSRNPREVLRGRMAQYNLPRVNKTGAAMWVLLKLGY